jgi:hypothetical protein
MPKRVYGLAREVTMSDIRQIGGWTVDFRSKNAYIRLPIGTHVLCVDAEGAKGIISMNTLDKPLRRVVKYPETFDLLQEVPFVEFFGKQKYVLR